MLSVAELTKMHAEEAPAAPAPQAPKGFKPNLYPGKCADCNGWVGEGEGSRFKTHEQGKWLVCHVPHLGGCPQKAAPAPAKAPSQTVEVKLNGTAPLLPGTYTVEFEDHSYKTIKINLQEEDSTFLPGHLTLGFLSGTDNESSYTGFGHITPQGAFKLWKKHSERTELVEAVRVLVGDPKAASQAFGRKAKRCGLCNRKLSTPESLDMGIGPDCAGKF